MSRKTFSSTKRAEALMAKVQEAIKQTSIQPANSGFSPYDLEVLRKPRSKRTELDLLSIETNMKRMAWVEKLPTECKLFKDAFLDVLKIVRITKYYQDNLLFSSDDPVDCLVLVINGSLNAVTHDEKGRQVRSQSIMPGMVLGGSFLHDHAQWGKMITVETESVELMELQKIDYEYAMEDHKKKAIRDRAEFLSKIPPFNSRPRSELLEMAKCMKHKYFPSNHSVITQGGIPNEFFVIWKGYCRVIKEIAVPAKTLTILRAPMDPAHLTHQSTDPNPPDCRRRPITASLGDGRCNVVGPTNWRCAWYRTDMPPKHHHHGSKREQIHGANFKVNTSGPRIAEEHLKSPLPKSRPQTARLRLPKKSPIKFDMDALRKRKNSSIVIRDNEEIGTRSHKKGNLIFDIRGDELAGSKKIFLELRELWRGQFFGELGIINKSVRSANVVTKGPVEVLVLSKLDFWKFGLDSGDGAEALAKAVDSYGYVTDNELMSNMMEDEFHWTNFRQDMAMDSIFGSTFADRFPYGKFRTESGMTIDPQELRPPTDRDSPSGLDPSTED